MASPAHLRRVADWRFSTMASSEQIEQLTDRVERLLLRYEELQRTNALLDSQLQATLSERDLLRSRLNAARARVDALLERLPQNMLTPDEMADAK
jgi:cell division protein ZapB